MRRRHSADLTRYSRRLDIRRSGQNLPIAAIFGLSVVARTAEVFADVPH
jgi:hypothetical protein